MPTYNVTPDLALPQLVGRLVRVERVSFGQPGQIVGRFRSLSHATKQAMRMREPGAGGMFTPANGGSTALALPYGLSTITPLE